MVMKSNAPLIPIQLTGLFVVFGLEDLFATVKTVRTNVVTHVRLTTGRLNRQLGRDQKIVRTVHAAFGGGFLVLLNSHGVTPKAKIYFEILT